MVQWKIALPPKRTFPWHLDHAPYMLHHVPFSKELETFLLKTNPTCSHVPSYSMHLTIMLHHVPSYSTMLHACVHAGHFYWDLFFSTKIISKCFFPSSKQTHTQKNNYPPEVQQLVPENRPFHSTPKRKPNRSDRIRLSINFQGVFTRWEKTSGV